MKLTVILYVEDDSFSEIESARNAAREMLSEYQYSQQRKIKEYTHALIMKLENGTYFPALTNNIECDFAKMAVDVAEIANNNWIKWEGK